jgi:hypothetical protein
MYIEYICTIVTRPALGIEAAPTEATVAVKLIIIYSTSVRCLSFICAIKIGATALLIERKYLIDFIFILF